jgi:hypothetical protein
MAPGQVDGALLQCFVGRVPADVLLGESLEHDRDPLALSERLIRAGTSTTTRLPSR